MNYYLVEIQFNSKDPNWSLHYLENPDLRLTALLKDYLDNVFWEKYSETLIQYNNSDQLLLRVKSIKNDSVYLTQVWKNEQVFNEYKSSALQGIDLADLLKNKGIHSHIKNRIVSEPEVFDLIKSIQLYPHILQFVNEKFRHNSMKIGDPLKKGLGHLPEPWKKASEILKDIPHLKLNLTAPIKMIEDEIEKNIDGYSHIKLNLAARNEIGKDRPWYGRGLIDYNHDSRIVSEYLAIDKNNLEYDEMGDPRVFETELSNKMPKTMEFVYSIVSKPRVTRLLWIPPGAVLPWHSHCQSKVVGIQPYRKMVLQIPIITNPNVIYRVCEIDKNENQSHDKVYKSGEVWLFNSWHLHQVENRGDQSRIALYIEAPLTDQRFRTHVENSLIL